MDMIYEIRRRHLMQKQSILADTFKTFLEPEKAGELWFNLV